MRLLRVLGLAIIPFTIALSVSCPATEEEEKAITRTQMRRVWEAIMDYKKDHGEVPDHLSDLIPNYLPDKDALISPTETRTGRHGDNDYRDPKVRSSFCYEFSALKFARNTEMFRTVKYAQMEEFGPVVPILRCFLYDRVLSVAYSGDIYESQLFWETAPEAKAITARIGLGPGFKNGEFATLKVLEAESRKPIAGAEVRLTKRSYHFLPLPDRTFQTAADGTVQIPLGPPKPPSRRLTVTVLKRGFLGQAETWEEDALPREATISLAHLD